MNIAPRMRARRLEFARVALPGWLLVASVVGVAQPGEGLVTDEARRFVAEAVAVAGDDLAPQVAELCRKPRPARVTGLPPAPGTPLPAPVARPPEIPFPPTRVFDDVYYFGSPLVGATAIDTAEGIILIDTLTLTEHAERILVAGMRQMGLDPARIRYVVLTHSHGDHHGGVKYLREHFPGFQVVMSAADWAYAEQPYYMADGSLDPAPKPPRAPEDIAYADSHDLRLGDTRVRLIETPGHTPGTSSLLYDVTVRGRKHTVMQWGGGSPLGTEYSLETVARFVEEARAARPSIRWSSHADDRMRELLAAIRESPASAGALVEGEERFARYLQVLMACKKAAVAG